MRLITITISKPSVYQDFFRKSQLGKVFNTQ